MPFVPLTPEEQKSYARDFCRDEQHNPPNMMVIYKPMKWQCPSCGKTTMLYPSRAYLVGGGGGDYQVCRRIH